MQRLQASANLSSPSLLCIPHCHGRPAVPHLQAKVTKKKVKKHAVPVASHTAALSSEQVGRRSRRLRGGCMRAAALLHVAWQGVAASGRPGPHPSTCFWPSMCSFSKLFATPVLPQMAKLYEIEVELALQVRSALQRIRNDLAQPKDSPRRFPSHCTCALAGPNCSHCCCPDLRLLPLPAPADPCRRRASRTRPTTPRTRWRPTSTRCATSEGGKLGAGGRGGAGVPG